jgi:hypothetical protein
MAFMDDLRPFRLGLRVNPENHRDDLAPVGAFFGGVQQSQVG